MMNEYQGDLSDIVLASGGVIRLDDTTAASTSTIASSTTVAPVVLQWPFGSQDPDPGLSPFPDPFFAKRGVGSTPFIDVGRLEDHQKRSFYGDHGGVMINNFNVFSRALQISPDHLHNNNNDNNNINNNNSGNNNNNNNNSNNNDNNCGFVERSSCEANEIPNSLRNLGNKRRKSQAKKVVCIPAGTTGANNRQSGEVVPSDLWAWRKYGQKPIKGSPYPRGYYRCSSSKGCSARKQVERSRTDPNMLVITYTFEHNHPWPTQRNALAGSSRSQLSNHITSASSEPSSFDKNVNNTYPNQEKITSRMQVEEKGKHDTVESYKPVMFEPNGNQPQQDFFENLGFEPEDPLNFIFTQDIKKLDPFSALFDC